MPHIEWNDSYSVHVEEIDNQHKRWIDIMNKLHDTLMNEGDPKKLSTITEETLDAMKDYAEHHFAFEENYMKSIGFPELESHANIHHDFIRQVKTYQDEIASGKIVLNSKLMKNLQNWLLYHILEKDKKYAVTSK